MKKIPLSKFIACCTVLSVLSVFVPSLATAEQFGDFMYEDRGSYIEITGYEGSSQTVNIPAAIGGKDVSSIGASAFWGRTGLTSITIPNSITSIGESAFSYCSGLTNITIPNSVTSIADNAFYDCNGLTSIMIPSSVSSIGSFVFASCSSLISINVNSSNSIFIGEDGVLYQKDEANFTLICYPAGRIGKFSISGSITSIGNGAFQGCTELTGITIPGSISSIGWGAFQGCTGLANIAMPNNVTSIGAQAFDGCTGLTGITISDSVTSIGVNAFHGCTGLTDIRIPNSVTSIEQWAFIGCTGLTSIIIPSSVTSIGDSAFRYCTGLTSITITSSVTNIAGHAFSGCTGLVKAIFQGGRPSIAADTFTDVATGFKVYYHINSSLSWAYYTNAPKQVYCIVTIHWQYDSEAKVMANVINGYITAPTAPIRTGYTLSGWYKDAGGMIDWDFFANKAADVTLYAKWTPTTLTAPVSAKAVSSSYDSIKISWAAVSYANGYEVYRSATSTGTYSLVETVTATSFTHPCLVTGNFNSYFKQAYEFGRAREEKYCQTATRTGAYMLAASATSCINANLITGRQYCFKVRAYRLKGTTEVYDAYSSVVNATPIPATPVLVMAVRTTATSIQVSWGAVAGATKYEVWRSLSSTGTYILLPATASLHYTNKGLATGKTFYYKVKAYRRMGSDKVYGNFSLVVSVKP